MRNTRIQTGSTGTLRFVGMALAIVAFCPGRVHAQAGGASWLDQARPDSWNKPGVPIPAAPKVQDNIDQRCREQARPPELEEDKRLRDRGWDLLGAYQGGWQVRVIRGTAGYDGMCRPLQYQDFVFVRGVFAGTLSPQAMQSRVDGALGRVFLQSDSRVTAEYARYAAKDPLCCPSRTTSTVFEISKDPPLVRSVSASTSPNQPGGTQSSPPAAADALSGTSWRLVKFQGGDDRVLTPSDSGRYTIAFDAKGSVSVRIDCNRGHGTWKASGPNQLAFGPLALTRAMCPPAPLNDRLAKDWQYVRSYMLKGNHLFLSLLADGGTYEFESMSATNSPR